MCHLSSTGGIIAEPKPMKVEAEKSRLKDLMDTHINYFVLLNGFLSTLKHFLNKAVGDSQHIH